LPVPSLNGSSAGTLVPGATVVLDPPRWIGGNGESPNNGEPPQMGTAD